MKKTLLMLAVLALFAAGVARADSIYTVTLEQAGSNVVETGSGTIDLTGLTYLGAAIAAAGVGPDYGEIVVGVSGSEDNIYTGFTGPTSFGSGGVTPASSGSGLIVGIDDNSDDLGVPSGYVSGDSLATSTDTYDDTTLSALGLTLGTYTWTWDDGADSFVLEIGSPAAATVTPEPGSLLLLGTGLVGFTGALRRKRAAKKQTAA